MDEVVEKGITWTARELQCSAVERSTVRSSAVSTLPGHAHSVPQIQQALLDLFRWQLRQLPRLRLSEQGRMRGKWAATAAAVASTAASITSGNSSSSTIRG